jgi:hypothetical protein
LRFGDALVASQKALGSLVKMNDWAYFRELFNIFRKLSLVEGMASTSKLIFMSSSASRWRALWAPRHNRKEHVHPIHIDDWNDGVLHRFFSADMLFPNECMDFSS